MKKVQTRRSFNIFSALPRKLQTNTCTRTSTTTTTTTTQDPRPLGSHLATHKVALRKRLLGGGVHLQEGRQSVRDRVVRVALDGHDGNRRVEAGPAQRVARELIVHEVDCQEGGGKRIVHLRHRVARQVQRTQAAEPEVAHLLKDTHTHISTGIVASGASEREATLAKPQRHAPHQNALSTSAALL